MSTVAENIYALHNETSKKSETTATAWVARKPSASVNSIQERAFAIGQHRLSIADIKNQKELNPFADRSRFGTCVQQALEAVKALQLVPAISAA